MDADLLPYLRCPIDPRRVAALEQHDQTLKCSCCSVEFAIRQGLPILIPSEATLPPTAESVDDLPCRKR